MDRLALERHQVWIYRAAIAGGLALGTVAPGIGPRFEFLLWPVLATLLYSTFVRVPLAACAQRLSGSACRWWPPHRLFRQPLQGGALRPRT